MQEQLRRQPSKRRVEHAEGEDWTEVRLHGGNPDTDRVDELLEAIDALLAERDQVADSKRLGATALDIA